ncbi:MAG: DEAD/DEAH box helicase [Alistipes sp.]|nr:DEAD/DEAH box helicase [Alistipes sp.]
MKFVPHDYQKYCIDYIKTHPISALLLDCGLGKTVITLTAINDLMFDELKVSKVLVIAPLRVTQVWKAEIEKWDHLNELDISLIVGNKNQRISAINANAFIYAVNRENIKWLVEYYEKNGLRWDFNCIVIDELSSFRNYQSQRFKWLRKVRPFVKRWVGLTGTPTSNGLMDLWAEIGILDGGERLGRFIGRFRESYFKPGSMNPSTGVVFSYVPRPDAEQQIYEKISDITISMKALDYLKMPECIFVNHEVEMNAAERKLYDQLKHDLIIPLEDGDIDAANAASLSNKLLQMANGAVYDENKEVRAIHSRKLEMLEDLIESANGQPVLIAYWFKHDRTRIMEHLSSCGYAPRDIKDSADITDWNAGKIPVALIHPASAGHGLNIQSGGHILIWYGLTWSLELYQQTNARLWRQGQKSTVTIHHIVTKNTVDEDVLKALASKDVTQENLIAAVKARL